MFKKTRFRIIMSIMLAMVITLVGTLAIIYFSSYRDLYQSNQEMLEIYISQYNENGNPYEESSQLMPEEIIAPAEDMDTEDFMVQDSVTEEEIEQNQPPDMAAQNDSPGEPPIEESSEGINFFDGDVPDDGTASGIENAPGNGNASDDGDVPDDDNAPGDGNTPGDDNAPGDGNTPDDEEAPDLHDAQTYLLSTFYSVYFDGDEVICIDRSNTVLYSDEQLVGFAQEILSLGKTEGISGNLVYRVESMDGTDLVVMMDNMIMEESITSLFRYTLIFGGVACVVIFLIALGLSSHIVRPVEEGYEKQKQFISDAGHELKTPVAAIGANIETLSNEIGENRWLSNIEYENQRMAAMIQQLLLLSRTEGAPVEMERMDLSQMLMQEILSFEAVAFEKGHRISGKQIEEGIFVKGNASQMGQLLSILLDNAVEHAGGRQGQSEDIIVKLAKSRNRTVLSVSNPGDEIPKEQQKMLFERFYRMDESRSGEGSHFGLGLAIAKAIVETHHGGISVACEQGQVIFMVVLPLA